MEAIKNLIRIVVAFGGINFVALFILILLSVMAGLSNLDPSGSSALKNVLVGYSQFALAWPIIIPTIISLLFFSFWLFVKLKKD